MWQYGAGIERVMRGFWFRVLSVILASLSTPGSSCGRRGSDHVSPGNAAARMLDF